MQRCQAARIMNTMKLILNEKKQSFVCQHTRSANSNENCRRTTSGALTKKQNNLVLIFFKC